MTIVLYLNSETKRIMPFRLLGRLKGLYTGRKQEIGIPGKTSSARAFGGTPFLLPGA
jgi:hypothetical protein